MTDTEIAARLNEALIEFVTSKEEPTATPKPTETPEAKKMLDEVMQIILPS